jgi:L-threonylcarbamoyladenylate synthase
MYGKDGQFFVAHNAVSAQKVAMTDDLIMPFSVDAIEAAADIVHENGLVAIPTETVYGLAADASDDEAVAKIFEAKGRPQFNPLIVHVTGLAMAEQHVKLNETAYQLAEAFWPGPLTLVLPRKRKSSLSLLVSAGLKTIALRCPEARAAEALLEELEYPFAAPSANPSGKISPTTAQHVYDGLGDKVDLIIDDGPCEIGLESTILMVKGTDVTLLRPGSITAEEIEEETGIKVLTAEGDNVHAPGMLASHYAPEASMRLNVTEPAEDEAYLGFGEHDRQNRDDLNLSDDGDLLEAAANLFAHLHEMDEDVDKIAVAPIPEEGLGIAINDRLRRAAAKRD